MFAVGIVGSTILGTFSLVSLEFASASAFRPLMIGMFPAGVLTGALLWVNDRLKGRTT